MACLACTCFTISGLVSAAVQAQQLIAPQRYHLILGAGFGPYITGGGFDLGDQELDYQGFHFDLGRVGIAHRVANHVRMELAVKVGMSCLTEPGYRERLELGGGDSSRLGGHAGFELSGYYRFEFGLTLGLGADTTVAFGEFLDTSFFRVLPAIGWELSDPLEDWFLHVRWVLGLTLLHGLEEGNDSPRSNLTWTGLQVVYGL